MRMRTSRVLRKLRAGEIVRCVKLNTVDPRVAEIAAMSGYDVLWYCREHVPSDWMEIENCVRAAKIHDVDVMVRVNKGSYSDYIRPLELDAAGILIPHVKSVAEARDIVKMTRFHPLGLRPLDGGNQDAGYCAVPVQEYIEQANTERFIAIQIEDVEAVDELQEIAAVEGLDILFFGPGDYSQSIGHPGQIEHPEVRDARAKVALAAAEHGKWAATPSGPNDILEKVELGYRFLSVGADVVGLQQYFASNVMAFSRTGDTGIKTSGSENETSPYS